MPYYGLLDEKGREVQGGGYHRLDMAVALFKISPPEDYGDDLTLVNVDAIAWPHASGPLPWDVTAIAVYDEADSAVPVMTSHLGRRLILPGDFLVVAPGGLRFGWHWKGRDKRGGRRRPPPAMPVREPEVEDRRRWRKPAVRAMATLAYLRGRGVFATAEKNE